MTATTVRGERRASERRAVAPFERIELRDPTNWVDLAVTPGDAWEVVVDGPAAMVGRVLTTVENGVLQVRLEASFAGQLRDAITISLTRHHLMYRVSAPRLLEVRVAGLVTVSVDAFGADAPVVTRLEPVPPSAPRPPFAPRPPV